VNSMMVVFPDSRAQVWRVVSPLKREVYHLTQAPNGGHIQHPPAHPGDELHTLDLYFPSPLLPPDQVYSEGYDKQWNHDEKDIIAFSGREIGHEVVGNAPEHEACTKCPAISHKGEDPEEGHKAEGPEAKEEQVRNQAASRGNQI
jgi:hypothetical protein